MSEILVTGAAGFIGSRTAELLLEKGYAVTGIDNLNDSYDAKLKEFRLGALEAQSDFRFQRMDIEDRDSLDVLFAENSFQAVINLAARAGVRESVEDPFGYISTNVTGTVNLLDRMKKHGVEKLVLASSSSLYAGQPTPFAENLPLAGPISPYAASKKAAEDFAYTYHHLHRIDVSILRYFTVFGPAGRPNMMPFRLIQWIRQEKPVILLGDGTQTRDFTYIDDIAEGTVMALKRLGHEIVNLGGGRKPLPLNAVVSLVENLLGKKAIIDRRPPDPSDMIETGAEIEKARKILNWTPKVTVEEGFRRTVEWHERNAEWLRNLQG